MNTKNYFFVSAIAAAATLAFASAPASAAAYLKYEGVKSADGSTDRNWFNPANWSGGRVPGPEDSVVLDADDYAVIDEAQSAGSKRYPKEILVVGVAVLEVVSGAVLDTPTQVLGDRGQIIFRASGDAGGDLIVAGDSDHNPCTDCVLVQNPNPKSKRTVVLQSSVTVDMGLGGTTPGSVTQDASGGYQLAAGPGHYSTLSAETMVIDGDLKLSTYYGFEPRPGDTYQIMTISGRRSGEFIGLPEGGYVGCTDQSVGMRISYQGGDGNDIVISAEQTEPGICLLLPAVQKVREAAARSASIDARIESLPIVDDVEETTQTREHILLARQVGLATTGANRPDTRVVVHTD